MPEYTFRLTAIFRSFADDTYLAEALFFPEVSRFGNNLKKLENSLKENAVRITEEASALELSRRRYSSTAELGEAQIIIQPPPKSVGWKNPVELTFPVVRYRHGDDAYIAYIPALGIEIIAKDETELAQQIPAQIHAQLLRLKKNLSLCELMWLQRSQQLILVESSFAATVRTPKQIATSLDAETEDTKSVLEEVATDLSKEKLPPIYEADETVTRIADALTGRNPRSILLIGKSGVGKTAAFYEVARRRNEFHLGRVPFYATSGSRLVAGMSGFGMWEERCTKVWREVAKQRAILHFGNLLELMEVGKSADSNQGIASFFRPYISRGDLLCVAECTPEQLPIIERQEPHLADAFLHLKVEEPSPERGRAILLNYAMSQSRKGIAPIDFEGIEILDRLHRRYATYSAYPGRPLRFLKNLLQDNKGSSLSTSAVTQYFSAETGLPLFLLDDAVPLDLAATLTWFRERVIGQPEAVELIVNLLATVKARLTRAGKPIASLMFIGPTGVGKTEMAKSLAEFLFRDRNRLLRFDMSEYTDELSVQRLIGIWGKEGLLTAKVREQPFAVILLDEFEKAHSSFFDLLLQVLGEGRLTDSLGHVADFTNAVVIMTSNLGAETYKRTALGFQESDKVTERARQHFLKEVRAFVRPEFFNRLDRIVPFTPLDEATVLQIAHRELEKIMRRDGIYYRGVTLDVSDEVTGYLTAKGYDVRYGARPLKRTIERELLVPLAEGLNRQSADISLRADVRLEKNRLLVDVKPRTDEAGKVISLTAKNAPFAELAKQAAELRREAQNLSRSAAALDIRNQIFNLERIAKRLARKKWADAEAMHSLGRLPELKRGIEKLDEAAERIAAYEDEILLCFYGRETGDKNVLQTRLTELTQDWQSVLLSIYRLRFRKPDIVTLAIYGENVEWLFELAKAYYEIVRDFNASIDVFEFAALSNEELAAIKYRDEDKEKICTLLGRNAVKRWVDKPSEFFAAPRSQTVGIILHINSNLAFLRFEPERGLHTLTRAKHTHKNLVHTSEVGVKEYVPPAGIEKRGSINHQEKRRDYNNDENKIEDAANKARYYFDKDNLKSALRSAIEQRLLNDAKSFS
jgi:ATP-dependent Clp protease ATP-binding subunit ClpA